MLALGANLLFEKSEKVKSPCLAAQKYQKKHIKTKKTNFLKFFVSKFVLVLCIFWVFCVFVLLLVIVYNFGIF